MSAVAIIPARGGSRRIPRKNIRPFHGRPIIAYSIETARASGLFDRVCVSTDDPAIADIAASCGAWPIPRSSRLAVDEAGTQEVMVEALRDIECDYACCIYATAPTMTVADLQRGFDEMVRRDDYAYIHGWFYWGRAAWFGVRPLGEEMVRPERWIDINTEDDWQRAEGMYAALNAVSGSPIPHR